MAPDNGVFDASGACTIDSDVITVTLALALFTEVSLMFLEATLVLTDVSNLSNLPLLERFLILSLMTT